MDTRAMGRRLMAVLPRVLGDWFAPGDVSMKLGRYMYVHLHALKEEIVSESGEDMTIRAKRILGHDSVLCTLHYVKVNSQSLSDAEADRGTKRPLESSTPYIDAVGETMARLISHGMNVAKVAKIGRALLEE